MRLLACGALLAAAVLLAGCSGGGTPQPSDGASVAPLDAAALATAVATTQKVAPNHVTYTATLRKGDGRPHRQVTDARRGRGQGEKIDFDTDGTRAELRRLGGTAWLRSAQPALAKALPAGKPWVKMSASQATASGLPTVEEIIDLLYVTRAAGSVTDKGMTTTDRVATRTGSFAVDLRKAVCLAPEDSRLDIATLMNSDVRAPRSMTVEVSVDAFHLVRRMTVHARGAGITADYDVRVVGDDASVPVIRPLDGETVNVGDVPDLDRALSTPRPAAPACAGDDEH